MKRKKWLGTLLSIVLLLGLLPAPAQATSHSTEPMTAELPATVSDGYTIKLPAVDKSGLQLVDGSGELAQTVTGEITPIVLIADDSHILPENYASSLNGGILNNTGLNASYDSETGKLTISGTPTSDFNCSTFPTLTPVEAVITDSNGKVVSKHKDLSKAIGAAESGQTVEMKKNPYSAVSDVTLQNGATLKDTDDNAYTAKDDNTTVSVGTNGKVTLTAGTLEVNPAVSNDVSVSVKGNDNTTHTVSGNSKFTVTAGENASVTIANEGNSVTNGDLTFTAGKDGSTFPLGSTTDLSDNADNDTISVDSDKSTQTDIKLGTVGVGENAKEIKITLSSEHRGAVIKGNGTTVLGYVELDEAGSFTLDGKTYIAAAYHTRFQINPDGTVRVLIGAAALSDGQRLIGGMSGKVIENPADSGNDQVTVKAVANTAGSEDEPDNSHDLVTVPAGGKVVIDGKIYANKSDSDPLVLKVFKDGTIGLESGTLTEEIGDGKSLVGITSGATIANSGDDTITVTSDSDKDRVIVPKGEGSKVAITVNGKTTEYTNSAPVHEAGPSAAMKDLVIDVTKDGATLVEGYVSLDKGESIGAWGNTITNTSDTPFVVEKNSSTDHAAFKLSADQRFTDKDGNIYIAGENGATFVVDERGNIGVQQGSADVIPAKNKTPTVNVQESNTGGTTYPVSGSSPYTRFTVTVGDAFDDNSDKQKATVTIPDAGDSVSIHNPTSNLNDDIDLTFTAGQKGSTFFLDGSKLSNDGDSLTVGKNKSDDTVITVQEADSTADPEIPEIKVTIPAANGGDTTVTKGQPTIVTIGKDNDTFKVGDTSYPTGGGAKAGDQYAILADGSVRKVNAKLLDADNNLINAGDLSSMLNAATSDQTVEMVAPPETALTDATLKEGVCLEYTTAGENGTTNDYFAVNGNATMDVDTDGKVTLKSGSLYTELGNGNQAVKVTKDGSGSDTYMISPASVAGGFTVTTGKGNSKATVTILGEGESVYCYPPANPHTIRFVAGQDNSTFPLEGSCLANDGDRADIGLLTAPHDIALGTAADAPTVTLPSTNSGWTTVTKGQPDGYVGSVTLRGEGNSFTVNGKSYHFNAGGTAEDEATFGIRANGSVAMVSGSTELATTGEEVEVKPTDWTSGVSVSTPADNSNPVLVTSNDPHSAALVKAGDSVTIGGKTYKAAENTLFNFDEDGKVILAPGKTELNKDESILGGASGLEIKNTAADDTHKVTVKSTLDEDIVTVPAGGKVTIDGKEYINSDSAADLVIEIDAECNISLSSGKATLPEGSDLSLNGTNVGNASGDTDLTVSKNGTTATINAPAEGQFTIGNNFLEELSADMTFTVAADGTVTATLPKDGSILVNGVKYTAGEGNATLTFDPNGNFSISGAYTANIPGQTTHEVSGKVVQDGSGVAGATVTLTQGGQEFVKLATVTTDSQGCYKFPAVPAGTYNVVVVSGGKTMTKLVTVGDGDVDMGDLVLPTASVSSVVDVKPSSPVGAMVGGLDEVASNSAQGGSHVTITLEVDNKDEHDAGIVAIAEGQELVSLDFTVKKTVDTTHSTISDTNTVLEIILTFDTSDKTDIKVYRNLNGTATALAKLTERPTESYRDGTYYVGNGFVVVYTSKFSPYAIGYRTVTSSGSSTPISVPNVGKTENGSISLNPQFPRTGTTVTITVKPDEGYALGTLTVTDKYGNELTLTKISDTQYTYLAPNGRVDVQATFVRVAEGYTVCPKDETCPISDYTDAVATDWYHDGVHYCIEHGLMSGYGEGIWAPADATTRAQIVAILWRMSGCPDSDATVSFSDVLAEDWYTDALRWAVSNGIVLGHEDGTFRPTDEANREQWIAILYRYARYMDHDLSADAELSDRFADVALVSEYAVPAMRWAFGAELVNGVELDGVLYLNPLHATDRAQMATLIMRFCTAFAN